MRMGRSSLTTAIIAAATAAVAGISAQADTITLQGVPMIKAREVQIKNGQVFYKIATTGRDQAKSLSKVKAIALDAYPSMAKAEAAMAKGKWSLAASLWKTSYNKTAKKPELKIWIGRRRVIALDKAGKFDEAMEVYLFLLSKNSTNYVRAVQPQNAPKDEKIRKAVVAGIEKSLKSAKDAGHKKHLGELKAWLASGGKAPAPQVVAGGPKNSAVSARRSANVSEVKKLVDTGKHKEALARIEKDLQAPAAPLAALLYYQGQSRAASGQDVDALVSYMRVIVHFPAIRAFAQPARVEAGKIFVKRKQSHQAKRLWLEGYNAEKAKNSNMAKQFKVLLEGLKKT